MHPDLQIGNLELVPRPPSFPRECTTAEQRFALSGEMRLAFDQSKVSQLAWVRSAKETADITAAKAGQMLLGALNAAKVAVPSVPAPPPVLHSVPAPILLIGADGMHTRTELDGAPPSEPLNLAGFPAVSGKGMGTPGGGGGEDDDAADTEGDEDEADEGEVEAEKIAGEEEQVGE